MTEPLASRELAAFLAAMETGTVQGAAEALSLTQSAASKRIQGLERRLGVTLLRRGRGGVEPTEAGRALYPRARIALEALAEAERSVRVKAGPEVITIAASHTVGEFLLPRWLMEFRRIDAATAPQVTVVNSPGALAQLRRGKVNFGFVEGDDSLADLEPIVVMRDRIVVVVAASHHWAGRDSISPQELAGEPYLAREARSGTRAVAEGRLRAVGVELEPSMQLASLGGVKLALLGGGFTLISELAVGHEAHGELLVPIPVRHADLSRDIYAVRDPATACVGGGARFWRFLRETIANRPR